MEKYNKLFNTITELIENSLLTSKDIKKELDNAVKNNIEIFASKFNLVTREEFDAQVEVLRRTQDKLHELERQITELNLPSE